MNKLKSHGCRFLLYHLAVALFLGLFGAATDLRAVSNSAEGSKVKQAATKNPEELVWHWAPLKGRFRAVAKAKTPTEDYRQIERRAWSAGLLIAQKSARELYKTYDSLITANQGHKPEGLNKIVAAALRSRHTEFLSSGAVEVEMEVDLPSLLVAAGFPFKPSADSGAAGGFTGLVLRSEQAVARQPLYKVVDESGKLLFSIASIAKDSFAKVMMGRWYAAPSRKELVATVGAKPVSLAFKVNAKGEYEVQGAKWQEALAHSAAVLEQVKIAIVAPIP